MEALLLWVAQRLKEERRQAAAPRPAASLPPAARPLRVGRVPLEVHLRPVEPSVPEV